MIQPESPTREQVVYGEKNGWGLVFIPRDRAVEIAAHYNAIDSAKTWGT